MIVVLSYRASRVAYDRGDRIESYYKSDFDSHMAQDEKEAAAYITRRLSEHEPDSKYVHLLLLDWEDVLCADCIPFAEYAQSGANSIHYVDEVFSEHSCGEDEVAARCKTRAAVVARISHMVDAQLAELKKRRIEEREKAYAEAERRRREEKRIRELQEFKRLKQLFEPDLEKPS